MKRKVDFLLTEALAMSPSEKALLAKSLIASLDQDESENVDQEWIDLANKRLSELEDNEVHPLKWNDIKQKIKS